MSVSLTAGKAALTQVVKFLSRYEKKNTAALMKAWDEAKEDWLVELRRALPDVLRRLENVEQAQEKLHERAADREFQRLLDNVSIEASREAIDERRRMLAHVGAGTFDLTMTIAQAARCERVIRELDPEDVVALRHVNGWREFRADARFEHLELLIAAGCVVEIPGDNAGGEQTVKHSVTKTGTLVMRLLATYEPRT